jgi:large subunit ribosomal protein L18
MNKVQRKIQRQKRIRKKIRSTSNLPRLSVFRSNQHIYAQIIDDAKGITMLSVAENSEAGKGTKIERAKAVGIELGKLASGKKITQVVFDKGSYSYHGRVKALAEGAREGGLQF